MEGEGSGGDGRRGEGRGGEGMGGKRTGGECCGVQKILKIDPVTYCCYFAQLTRDLLSIVRFVVA